MFPCDQVLMSQTRVGSGALTRARCRRVLELAARVMATLHMSERPRPKQKAHGPRSLGPRSPSRRIPRGWAAFVSST